MFKQIVQFAARSMHDSAFDGERANSSLCPFSDVEAYLPPWQIKRGIIIFYRSAAMGRSHPRSSFFSLFLASATPPPPIHVECCRLPKKMEAQ